MRLLTLVTICYILTGIYSVWAVSVSIGNATANQYSIGLQHHSEILKKFRPYVSSKSMNACHYRQQGSCNPAIQYMIVTGQKNYNKSRTVWSTWVQHIYPPDNVLFVTDGPLLFKVPFPFVVAYHINDNATLLDHYRMSQLKWMYAIINASNVNPGLYDWLVLVDDDSFVIHSSLQTLLKEYSSDEAIILGKRGADCDLMCGGAGLALSRKLVDSLKTFPVSKKLELAFRNGIGKDKKIFSDVVLTHFIRSFKLGRLLGRTEFKNFPPTVSLRWYARTGLKPSAVVTFHHINNEIEYQQIYSHYYHNLSKNY